MDKHQQYGTQNRKYPKPFIGPLGPFLSGAFSLHDLYANLLAKNLRC